MPNFKQMPMTPSQVLLFPMSVEESVPKDCDVRVLGEAMDLLDRSVFEAGYSETGSPPYPHFRRGGGSGPAGDELYGSGTGCAHQCGRC